MEHLTIETPRLLIRALQITDLEAFHVYRSNPDVAKYQNFHPMSLEDCEAFIRRNLNKLYGQPGQWVQYAIENKAARNMIGDCAIHLHAPDPRIAEIGITISHLEQRKGYAKEALLGILSFLFDQKDIHRVVETADAENIASINMLKSVGFRQEGYFIENIFFKGKWGSEVQFAMLKREWEEG